MLKTHLTQEHGLNLPFVSADMGFIALPELMAAFSNAGGGGALRNCNSAARAQDADRPDPLSPLVLSASTSFMGTRRWVRPRQSNTFTKYASGRASS